MSSKSQPKHVTIRELHTMEDLVATIELQQAVWQMAGEECSSAYVQNAVIHNGGHVLCAEYDGRMVGFCFGFPAKRGDEVWLWSHMTGVHPDYQGQGIGFKLKQQQRLWALDNGYSVIGWTFDPMQRGNANFNLNQLGAIANRYYVNHYGEMKDSINAGLASDRLEAYWQLDNPRVNALAKGNHPKETPSAIGTESFVVRLENDTRVLYDMPDALSSQRYHIEIPKNIGTLKRTQLLLAQEWQVAVRNAIIKLLTADYVVDGFVNADDRCWYIMSRQ